MRNFSVIIAARTGSTRLPGKALMPIMGVASIQFQILRLKQSKLADKIVLATTTLDEDNDLANIAESVGIRAFRGDPTDLIQRYIDAANRYDIDYAIRVTGDCPFVDGETVDYCIDHCSSLNGFDLATTKSFFPVGIDYEFVNMQTLKTIHNDHDLNSEDREHLTLYLYKNKEKFKIENIIPPAAWSYDAGEFTIDTQSDYDRLTHIIQTFDTMYFNTTQLIEATRNLTSNG